MKQMKRSIKTAVLSLTLALMLGEIGRAEPPQLMSVDEIRPGMKGIGKTVFSGTKIEEFDVEILGVLTNQSPGGDEIIRNSDVLVVFGADENLKHFERELK